MRNVASDFTGGLADGDVVGRGCGVADGGDACTDLIDGGHGGDWDFPVGVVLFGRGSDISGRDVSGIVGASCSGCGGACGGVGGLPPRVGCRPAGVGAGDGSTS